MKRAFVAGLAALGTGLVTTLVLASPARATDPIPVESECLDGWYVNPDEGSLLPEQLEEGLLFDGPSLVHHAIDPPISLADLTPGTFVADLDTGVLPLFKVETLDPYSTLNYVGGGLWWSSKIAAGTGSQSSPQTPAVLAGLAPYKSTTIVYSFGVGYANDSGNTATVSLVSFMGVDYDLTCEPAPETTEPTTPATTETTSPPATTTAPATTTPAATTTVPATTTQACVDLNTATVDQLKLLIEVDSVLAQRIVDRRPFTNVDELLDVDGIGTVRLQQIKDQGLVCALTTPSTSDSSTAARLPVTGSSFTGLGIIGAGLIGVGVVILIALRIKRNREESA